jgi:peptidyl-tRNA hydrolase
MRARVTAVAASVLIAASALLSGVGAASAARLEVAAADLAVRSVDRSCTGTVAATAPTGATATAVLLTVPAACAGLPVTVVVRRGATVVAAGTATAVAGGPTSVTVPSYAPSPSLTAASTVDGWVMDTTWSYTPPSAGPAITCTTSNPDRPCSATVTLRNDHVWDWGYDLDIEVRDARTSPANNPVTWTVEIDFSNASYPWVPNGVDGWSVLATTGCSDLPVLRLTGRPDHYNHELRNGTVVTFSIQPHSNGAGNLLACG